MLAVIGAAAGAASADAPKPIDISKVRDKLDAYRDETGHYIVVQRDHDDDSGSWVFYGDGKTMYQQRVFGESSGDGAQSFTVWAPRSEFVGAQITLPGGGSDAPKPTIACGSKSERTLAQLPADQAHAMLGRAKFLPPLWQHQMHLLARDDDGTYYFVDVLRDEVGGGSPRLFVGKRAAQMKQVTLTNVVSDPAGEVFATKDGSLKTFGTADKPPVWRHADKTTELTALDLTEPATRFIVYRDFAIYGALGTPCDSP